MQSEDYIRTYMQHYSQQSNSHSSFKMRLTSVWLPHVVMSTNASPHAAIRAKNSQYTFLFPFGWAALKMSQYIFMCVSLHSKGWCF